MNRKNSFISRLILLIILLALPALACTSLTGDSDEGEPAAETTGSDQAPAAESEDQAAAPDAGESGDVSAADSGDSDQEASEASDASEASGGSEKSVDEVRDSIIGALRSGLEVDSMRLRVLTEDLGSGLVTEVTLAFVRPDRYQMNSEGVEFIIIDDTTYMSSGDGEWLTLQGTEMTSTVETMLDAFAGSAVIEDRQDTLSQSNVNYEGKESINGIDTLVYSYDEGFEAAGFSGLVKMWIGEDDGLLYRQEVESKIGEQKSRIIMEFEYGADVVIEPPV